MRRTRVGIGLNLSVRRALGGLNPKSIAKGLMFWTKDLNQPFSIPNATEYVIENEVGDNGITFGTDGTLTFDQAIGNIKSFAFAIKLDDVDANQTIFTLNGTDTISVNGGVIVAPAFDDIHVDCGANNLIDQFWHYVVVTSFTDINISNTSILNSSLAGDLVLPIIYTSKLNEDQISKLLRFFAEYAPVSCGIGTMEIGYSFIIR